MEFSRKVREQMMALCGFIHDDDGLEAKRSDQKSTANESKDREHKQLRLCRQIGRALHMVLPMAPCQEARGLQIDSVRPGSNSTGVTVTMRLPGGIAPETKRILRDELRSCEGWLREQIAQSINRKRVPRLSFEFIFSHDDNVGEPIEGPGNDE